MGYERKSKNNTYMTKKTFESNFELHVGTKVIIQFKMHSPTEAVGIQNPRPFVNISANSVNEDDKEDEDDDGEDKKDDDDDNDDDEEEDDDNDNLLQSG